MAGPPGRTPTAPVAPWWQNDGPTWWTRADIDARHRAVHVRTPSPTDHLYALRQEKVLLVGW